MSAVCSRIWGIRSALSSRLTAGYLHTCAVKEQRAGGGSEVKCMELKLHSTAVQPSNSLLQRGFILFNLSWTEEAGSSDLTGGSVRLIIWYHLGLSQKESGDFYSSCRRWTSGSASWRRRGSVRWKKWWRRHWRMCVPKQKPQWGGGKNCLCDINQVFEFYVPPSGLHDWIRALLPKTIDVLTKPGLTDGFYHQSTCSHRFQSREQIIWAQENT